MLDEDVAGTLTKSYQYSPWGQRLSQVTHNADGSDEDAYYGYNPHTDVETLTDKSGDTKATYGYTAYGKNDDAQFTGIDKPDTADPTKEPYNAYRFNAKRWDQASGDYDMGFRTYSPGLNRFLSRDSYNGALADLNLGISPWTGNRYAFGGGNPVTNVELDGHMLVADGGGGSGATSGCGSANACEHAAGFDQPQPDTIGNVSPHVLMHTNDPQFASLKKQYDDTMNSFDCLWGYGCTETKVWGEICGMPAVGSAGCPEGMKKQINSIIPFFDDDPVGNDGASLIESDNTVRRFSDPQSMRGITENEFKELAKANGLELEEMNPKAATGGRGWRAFNPSDKSVNAFWELGDPESTSRDIVHQGPYVKYQWQGNKAGFRVPAEGNPNPLSGDVGEMPEISAWRMPVGGGIEIPGIGEIPEFPEFPIE